MLLKLDTSNLPHSICHWKPGDNGYGWEHSEEWIQQLVYQESSGSESSSQSNFSDLFDYDDVSFWNLTI